MRVSRLLLLLAIIFAFPCSALTVTLEWRIPTANADGSPFAPGVHVDRTNVWCGPSPGNYTEVYSVGGTSLDVTFDAQKYCAAELVMKDADGIEVAAGLGREVILAASTLPDPLPVDITTVRYQKAALCEVTITTKKSCAASRQSGVIVPRGP